jgi:hypothetical protein
MKATVQHAAVVRALVATDAGLLFEQDYLRVRGALQETPGRREADQTAADDREVV